MEIRTISQLPGISTADIADDDLFEVSHRVVPAGGGIAYTSNSITYGAVLSGVMSTSVGRLVSEYEMNDDDEEKISLRRVRSELTELLGSVKSGGENLVFDDAPYVKDTNPGSQLATKDYVGTRVIGKYQTLVSTGSLCTGHLGVDEVSPKEKLVSCKIDAGSRMSNEFYAPASGLLVMWGIMADSGGLTAQEAYVQLLAEIDNGWVTLDFRPWIIGSKSSMYQYVGFNAPVEKGLKLCVNSGFVVSGINNSNIDNRVIPAAPSDDNNMPNRFYGYVIS